MKNIVSYAEENFDLMTEREFGPVDSLILSWAAYLHWPKALSRVHRFEGMRLLELFRAEYFDEIFQGMWDMEQSRRLFTALAANPRFRNIFVMGYTQQFDARIEKQFCGVCFRVLPDVCYIAFRGTDSTFVGWKEDFNMAFQYPVPSQIAAANYLAEAAGHCTGKLIVGGHSKGGNLAVYSAANCETSVQSRIERVYSHDGPGFLSEVLASPQFQAISPKLHKTLPQSSLVGMLLEQQENYRIIKSDKVSLWQHDPFSWVVHGTDFHTIDHLTADAKFWDRTLNAWILSLTPPQRERFVDALYGLFETNEISTLADFREDWIQNVPAIARTFSRLDGDTRVFLIRTVKALVALGVKNLGSF